MSAAKLTVKFQSSEPIYVQISDAIKKKIFKKEWQSGDQLPSEELLVNDLGVSRGTVRKAISILVDEGVLERTQGKGTYVAEDKVSYPFAQELTSYAESMHEKGLDFDTKVISAVVGHPSIDIQERLDIDADSVVLSLVRLRSVKNIPAVLLYNWISLDRCPGLEKVNFEKISLFAAIENSIGDKIKYGIRNFSAQKLTERQAKLIHLPAQDPILNLSQVTFNKNDQAIECSEVLMRTDQYQVTSVLYR